MSIYTVGVDGDFKTLSAASRQVADGDTVNILPGIYHELLICRVPRVTWQAAGGEVVIDGGWTGGRIDGTLNQVAISAPGVAVRGLTIRNVPGRGVGISAPGVVLDNCTIDNTSNAGISANGTTAAGIAGLIVRGNRLTRLGVGRLYGNRANGAMIFVRCVDSVIEGNTIIGGHGEGINIDKGSYRLYVAHNHIQDVAHVYVYFNRCVDCEAEANTLYNSMDEAYHHDEGWPAGIVFGDERAGGDAFPWQSNNRAIGNVVVGLGKFLQVRNNTKDTGGYDTQLSGHLIAGNTFVAGPGTQAGIEVNENRRGRPHRESIIRDNVVYGEVSSACDAAGVTWLNNGWTLVPPVMMQSPGDVYGDLGLVAPDAAGFNIDNYRPRVGSTLVGSSSDGTTIGALEPLPPDTGPDTAWLSDELAVIGEQLATAALGINDALLRLDNIRAQLNSTSQ